MTAVVATSVMIELYDMILILDSLSILLHTNSNYD